MLTECSFEIVVFPNNGPLQSEHCAWDWPPVRHWGHGTASPDEAAVLHLTRVSGVLHHQITGASLSPCLCVVQLPMGVTVALMVQCARGYNASQCNC